MTADLRWRLLPFLLLGLAAFVVGTASADTCSVTLSLAPAQAEVYVTANDDAGVVFEGAFAVTAAHDGPSEIHFSANVSTGWAATVSPWSVGFVAAEPWNRTLELTVVVPPGASAAEAALVTLAGRASLGDAPCGEGSAQVRVIPLPYFGPVVIKASPPLADVDSITGFATVELNLTVQTNAHGQVLARLTVRPADALAHDAPQDVALSPVGRDAVGAVVPVHFFAPDSTPRTYTVTVFADIIEANHTGTIGNFFRTTIQVRVLPQPTNGGVVALTAVGSMVTLGVAFWTWQATRPDRR